jgi:hypothetical protein
MRRRCAYLGLALGGITAIAAIIVACYDEPKPECGFRCGPAGACPPDYTCGPDQRCRLNGSSPLLVCGTVDAGVDAAADAAADGQMPDTPNPDAPRDAPPDAPIDAPIDAPPDAQVIDAPPDAFASVIAVAGPGPPDPPHGTM